jgi:hypothetical protein
LEREESPVPENHLEPPKNHTQPTQTTNAAPGAVTDGAKPAAVPRPLITLSVEPVLTAEEKKQRKVNKFERRAALAILAIAVGLIANDLFVIHNHILWNRDNPFWLALIPIVFVDLCLIFLMVGVAHRGTSEKDVRPFYLPDRWPAVFIMVSFYFTLALSFAHLNLARNLTASMRDSLYESFLTVATLEHSHYDVSKSLLNRALVTGELLSVVLLFFVFFPLLIARLALFKGETVSLENLSTMAKLEKDLLGKFTFTITSDSPVTWQSPTIGGTIPADTKDVKVVVDERGKAKISN